jgi:hypothetical protein
MSTAYRKELIIILLKNEKMCTLLWLIVLDCCRLKFSVQVLVPGVNVMVN